MQNNGFVLLNGRTSSDSPAQYTCTHIGRSTVDLGWINSSSVADVKDLKVIQEENPSDHFPFLIWLFYAQANSSETPIWHSQVRTLRWNPNQKETYKSALRHSEKIAANYAEESTNQLSSKLLSAIKEAAQSSEMIARTRQHHKNSQDWYDKECREKQLKVKQLFKNCKEAAFEKAEMEKYKSAKTEYKKMINHKKSKNQEKIRNKLANVKNTCEFWYTIRGFRSAHGNENPISLDSWEQFYNLNLPPEEKDDTLFYGVAHPTVDAEFTMEELDSAIARAKNNKAPGPDSIQNEFIKNLPFNWKLYVLCLLNKVLREEIMPNNWFSTLITLIHKKGDKMDHQNYRGIALVNHIAKLLTSMINARLSKRVEDNVIVPEAQAGFRPGRGCLDNLFSLVAALNCRLRQKKATQFLLFVDFKRAFDTVSHKLLWQKLFEVGPSAKMVRLLKNIYSTAHLKLQVNGQLSKEFKINEGVLQGELLSPLLFIIFIADLEKFLRENDCEGTNIDGYMDILLLLYADDLVIMASSEADLQSKIDLLNKYCKQNQLQVNTAKTKVLVCRRGGKLPGDPHFFYGNNELEITNKYDYLGLKISTTGFSRTTANEAILKAKMAVNAAHPLLIRSRTDSYDCITKIFDSIVAATLLYAAPI